MRRPLLASAGVAALLLLGGCGDDDSSTTAPDATAASDTTASDTTASDTTASDTTASDTTASAGAAEVRIADFAFGPQTLEVAVGTTVTFANDDDFAHTAQAEDDSFDTGEIAAGASATVTFDEPGTYEFFCGIHNYMTGTVTVA